MKTIFRMLCTILATCTYLEANANDPGLHRHLSSEAIKQFSACFPNKPLSSKIKKQFIDYTALEDNIRYNPLRFRQWHFFSPDGDLGLSQGGSRISMDKRFRRLDTKLHEHINDGNLKKAYKTLGRIAHYLQDVTSPAHVMPIYHWSGKKDSFDSYPFDANTASHNFKSNRDKVCSAASSQSSGTLFSILIETAQKTIEASHHAPLKISNGNGNNASWGLFWKEDKTCNEPVKPKFRDYGPFGNSFGDTEIMDHCDLDENSSPYNKHCAGPVCRINKNVYETFAENRHRQAIMATLKALYYVKSKLNETNQ